MLGSDSVMCAAESARVPATVKQMVQARGVGKEVKVKGTGGTTLRGKITSIGENSFTVRVDSKNVELPYSEVSTVQGPGLPKAAKITVVVIVVLIAMGIVSHFTV
jgi:hypothetical protein